MVQLAHLNLLELMIFGQLVVVVAQVVLESDHL